MKWQKFWIWCAPQKYLAHNSLYFSVCLLSNIWSVIFDLKKCSVIMTLVPWGTLYKQLVWIDWKCSSKHQVVVVVHLIQLVLDHPNFLLLYTAIRWLLLSLWKTASTLNYVYNAVMQSILKEVVYYLYALCLRNQSFNHNKPV